MEGLLLSFHSVPGGCRVSVCLIYEPARRRIAKPAVAIAGKTIKNGRRVRFGHPSRNLILSLQFGKICGFSRIALSQEGLRRKAPFAFTTFSVKRAHRSVCRRSGVPKYQIILPLKMPRATRRAFPIVLFRKLPYRGRRRFAPAAPQCAAVGCTLPHARCGWAHRS